MLEKFNNETEENKKGGKKEDWPTCLGIRQPWVLVPAYVCVCVFSRVQLFAAPWTVACQAPLFMGFYRQEYWNDYCFLL